MKTALLVVLLQINTAKGIPTPDDLLFLLFERDPIAALRFCAERPALHAGKGESSASDVDRTCEEIIDANFPAALNDETIREVAPHMIGALANSPVRAYLSKPFAAHYRKRTSTK